MDSARHPPDDRPRPVARQDGPAATAPGGPRPARGGRGPRSRRLPRVSSPWPRSPPRAVALASSERAPGAVVRGPAGRLGAPPHEVGVLDPMGRRAERARRISATAGPEPFGTRSSPTDVETAGVARPDEGSLALRLPGLEPERSGPPTVESNARSEGCAVLRPARYDEKPAPPGTPASAVRWEATPSEGGSRRIRSFRRPRERGRRVRRPRRDVSGGPGSLVAGAPAGGPRG